VLPATILSQEAFGPLINHSGQIPASSGSVKHPRHFKLGIPAATNTVSTDSLGERNHTFSLPFGFSPLRLRVHGTAGRGSKRSIRREIGATLVQLFDAQACIFEESCSYLCISLFQKSL
jgi:hypothetical protein